MLCKKITTTVHIRTIIRKCKIMTASEEIDNDNKKAQGNWREKS